MDLEIIKQKLRDYILPLVAEKHIIKIKEKVLFKQFGISGSLQVQQEILTAFTNLLYTRYDIRAQQYIFYDEKSKYFQQEKKRMGTMKSIYS